VILHLGEDVVIPVGNIIAIIDINTVGKSKATQEFLQIAEEEGFIQTISDEPPKSFVLAEIDKKTVVYMSPISSSTLMRRSGFVEGISLNREEI